MNGTRRTRLGRFSGVATRHAVFRTDAALEIDEMDHFEVRRKRVFFDDVLLVTHHRELGTAFFVANAFIAGGCWMFAFIFLMRATSPGVIIFSCLAAPSTIALIIRLILRVDVVTVFGCRSKAALRYTFRKRFARKTFADICERVRAAQQKVADEIAASIPIATPEEAPPPPLAASGFVSPPAPPVAFAEAAPIAMSQEEPPSPPPSPPPERPEEPPSPKPDETLPAAPDETPAPPPPEWESPGA